MAGTFVPIKERIHRRVRITEAGCWEWQGRKNYSGYGEMRIGGQFGRFKFVHRISYAEFVGPLVDGLQIDHLCRNRACCNPEHLEQVTRDENWRRSRCPSYVNSQRTHCKHGHELAPDNIAPWSPEGRRQCLACHRIRLENKKAARRAAARVSKETSMRTVTNVASAARWQERTPNGVLPDTGLPVAVVVLAADYAVTP